MKKIVWLMVVVGLLVSLPAWATMRDSADFVGVQYECSQVPTSASPIWDNAPSPYASSDGDYLFIDVLNLGWGGAGWYLPGTWGTQYGEVGYRNYTQGDESNPWQPDFYNNGYTLEVSTQVLDSYAGTYGYSFYFGEAGHGGLFDIEIFEDRITSGGAGLTLYTGDLTSSQHQIRLVRYPGAADDPLASPYVELYVDGALHYTGGRSSEGGIIYGAAWDQDWLYMGSLSGGARYSVKTDYIRMDFTGAYTPVPEPLSLLLLAGGAVLAARKRR